MTWMNTAAFAARFKALEGSKHSAAPTNNANSPVQVLHTTEVIEERDDPKNMPDPECIASEAMLAVCKELSRMRVAVKVVKSGLKKIEKIVQSSKCTDSSADAMSENDEAEMEDEEEDEGGKKGCKYIADRADECDSLEEESGGGESGDD